MAIPKSNKQQKFQTMYFTERDKYILEAIHAFDGMLGARQIMRLYNPEGKPLFGSWRVARERLSKLYQSGYIARPDRRQRAALTDMVYWLGERGAEYVAGLHGQDLSEFKWRSNLRWSLVEHDLAVNDFRLDVTQACRAHSLLELEEWIPAGEFWAHPDEVEYKDERGKPAKRRVRPDGFFVISRWDEAAGRWYRRQLLLELDRATEDNPRFAREKVHPGVAYVRSNVYKKRFGGESGRWLVVTTGERRMSNMLRQTERAVGASAAVFYFTVFDWINPQTVLHEPIWFQGGSEQPTALFPNLK